MRVSQLVMFARALLTILACTNPVGCTLDGLCRRWLSRLVVTFRLDIKLNGVAMIKRCVRRRQKLATLLVAAGALLHLPSNMHAADIVVTSSADSGPNTLRQAILDAAAGDRIVFGPMLASPIVLLTNLPVIDNDISFSNQGMTAVVIDRNGNGPLVISGGTVNLSHVNFVAGSVTPDITLSSTSTLIGNTDIDATMRVLGTFAPGASSAAGSIGTITVNGDVNASSSTFQVDVRGAADGPSDLVDINGALDVTGATLDPNFIGSDYAAGGPLTVIRADSAITGVLANEAQVFDLPNNPFLEATINRTLLSEIQFEFSDNGLPFASVVTGCNQLAAAAEFDQLRTLAPPDVTAKHRVNIK